jgi:hypothetical protein
MREFGFVLPKFPFIFLPIAIGGNGMSRAPGEEMAK